MPVQSAFKTELNTFTIGLIHYIALYNGDPDLGGTEVTNIVNGGSATRLQVNLIDNAGILENGNQLDFGNAIGATNITHYALYDSDTVGNIRYTAALNSTRVIDVGDIARFLIGALTVEFS